MDQTLKSELRREHDALIAGTDGRGHLLEADPQANQHLAETIDLSVANLKATGDKRQLGALNIAILEYEGGLLIAGPTATGNVGILTSTTTNLGLLLNRVRRLLVSLRGEASNDG